MIPKPVLQVIQFLFIFYFVFFVICSCEPLETPVVITSDISNIGQTVAEGGGTVISDGGANVTDRGLVWGITPLPTVSENIGITRDGSGTGDFKSVITGLAPGMFYYVRAYATNSIGTAYGDQAVFTTIEETTGPMKLFLYMEEETIIDLYVNRPPTSNELVNGYIKLSPEGEVIELTGLRFRGSSSRWLPKKSFAIRFKEPQDFLFGSNRMQLKATYTDPTMMREKLSMDMFIELGRPASRTKYFDLFINDIYEGLYVHVERVDANLLQHFELNTRGTLVRDEFRANPDLPLSVFGYKFDDDHPMTEELLKNNFDSRGEASWTALKDFVVWANNASPGVDSFASEFADIIDKETFIDWLAIHFLIADSDAFGDDYWLYKDTDDQNSKWFFIPWDKDLTFGFHWRDPIKPDTCGTTNDYFAYEYRLSSGWQNELIAKFLANVSLREELYKRMDFLMKKLFSKQRINLKIDALSSIIESSIDIKPSQKAFRLHPGNYHSELGYFDYHVETIMDYIELRYNFIDRQINTVSGDLYQAANNIDTNSIGSKVWFTDYTGWVIACLEVDDVIKPGKIFISVDKIDGINPGIDRFWKIHADDAVITGNITLFYRNDTRLFNPVKGRTDTNWFLNSEPVKDETGISQWDLLMCQVTENGFDCFNSYVNPYSNKVSANIRLTGDMDLYLKINSN